MLIRSLKMKNFRRFADCDLEFPEGVIGLVGNNGAGKSTIVEAISWALFGNNAARSGKDEIRSMNSGSDEECSVVIDFEIDNEPFRLIRLIKGQSNTGDAALFTGGEILLAKTTRAVNSEIERMLNLDLKNFQISFFARQKELNALSDLKPAERREHIIRLLGISDIDEALKLLREDSRDMQTEKQTKEKIYAGIEVTEGDIRDLNSELEAIEERLEKGERITSETKDIASRAKDRFDELYLLREKYNNIKNEIGQLEINIENENNNLKNLHDKNVELSEHRKQAESLKSRSGRYDSVKAKIEELDDLRLKYQSYKAATEEKEKLSSDRNRLEEDINELQGELKAKDEVLKNLIEKNEQLKVLTNDIEGYRKTIMDFNAEKKSLEDKFVGLSEQLRNIENLGPESRCDRCLRPLGGDYESIRGHFEKELSDLSSEIKAVSTQLSENENSLKLKLREREKINEEIRILNNRLAALQQIGRELSKRNENLKSLFVRIESVEKRMDSLSAVKYDEAEYKSVKEEFRNLSVLREEYIKHQSSIAALKDIPERIEKTERSIIDFKFRMENSTHELEGLGFSESDYQKARTEKDKARDNYHKAEITLRELKSERDFKKLEIENRRKELARKDDLKKEIDSLEKESEISNRLKGLFGNFKEDLISRIRPELSRISTYYIDLLTDGKYNEMEISEGYYIKIYDNGEPFIVERFSGGEKDIANLCLRLAISELACDRRETPFSFVVLDEIFGSLDVQHREAVLEALGNLRKRFRQIFVISHIEDIKDRLESVISVEELPDGSSKAELLQQNLSF